MRTSRTRTVSLVPRAKGSRAPEKGKCCPTHYFLLSFMGDRRHAGSGVANPPTFPTMTRQPMKICVPRLPLYQQLAALILVLTTCTAGLAEVSLPSIFGDHMVLQREQANKVWGKASSGEKVTVGIGGQSHTTTAGADGMWQVMLDPMDAGGPFELTIAGQNEIKIADVLVGEVWICSGQSNMAWKVSNSTNADLETLAADFPGLRMINFPQVGAQQPVWDHEKANWMVCSPDTVGSFSAVGYFFGRQLHETLDVPIGLINNAWGGSACEAWISRDVLAADGKYDGLLQRWDETQSQFDALSEKADLSADETRQMNALRGRLGGNQRPANIYNGVLKSHLGYGIRGSIWYQGESNASRAYQYRDLFPLMIDSWRKEWQQGDFPFYWVQLADFKAEKNMPSDSDWAELREAQTMTMSKLPNTGEAVIIDIGEGKDIHPRNKVEVGRRLARLALANDYGVKVANRSPIYKSMEKANGSIVLTFDHIDRGWRPFDTKDPVGFAVAGPNKQFVWADAKILADNRIEVSSASVPNPVAVRYAWADNPVCNMFDGADLPLTPFRTDDWPGVTANSQ
jgi:sialate O-acetylesterase